MPEILLIFAMITEAQASLKRLHAQPVSDHVTPPIYSEGNHPSLYQFDKGFIAISGIGILSAQMTVATHIQRCDEIWNLGMAGSLNDQHSLCKLYPVQKVEKYIPSKSTLDEKSQAILQSTLPPHDLETPGLSLLSSDFPIHQTQLRQNLGHHWDLIDMEGYGIAYAAHHYKKKCRLWKGVSDFASEDGRNSIHKHRSTISELISDKIEEELCKLL